LLAAAEGAGQVALQGAVQTALQLVNSTVTVPSGGVY
jgi:hypothetical protein